MNNTDVVTAFVNALKSKGIKLSEGEVQAAIAQAILFAEYAMPGCTGLEKETWVLNKLVSAFESIDHLMPYVGKFMDSPMVNQLQYAALKKAVHTVFEKLESKKLVNIRK